MGSPDFPARKISSDEALRAAQRACSRWARWFGGLDSCLTRSLVAGALLAGSHEVVLHVGFRPTDQGAEAVDGRLFLPLAAPLDVDAGDRIHATIKAVLDDDTHLWIWRGRAAAPDGSKNASFQSSTAFFNPESPAVSEVFHEDCVPALSDDGRIAREILSSLDGKRSVAGLAAGIMNDHPGRFEYEEDAVIFVRDVVEKFGETILRLDD